MIEKLKILESVTAYSTENTWQQYKDIVLPIKKGIINQEIQVINVSYQDDFDEKYNPYTKDKNWGSNLDEFVIKVYSNFEAKISYYNINKYSSFNIFRNFKFEIKFNLPENLLYLFNSAIEREFYYKCAQIREKELEQIEEKRIAEIGEELLKGKNFEQ